MSALQKTAVSVLQEMMVKLGQVAEYEVISQSVLQHEAVFEASCKASGVCGRAAARSKRDAKQLAAHAALVKLAARGFAVPPPFHLAPPPPPAQLAPEIDPADTVNQLQRECADGSAGGTVPQPPPAHSHVALLAELCAQYSLGAPEYTLLADTGPAHQRLFTVRARVGSHERHDTATTKKAARQRAASQLYAYLRTHLSRLTEDFVEEEALARAHEKAMERYSEAKDELGWRPDLGRKVADYHLGLAAHLEPERQAVALAALAACGSGERALAAAAAALALVAEWEQLPAGSGALQVVTLMPTAPPLTAAGADCSAAAAAACRFLRQALRPRDLA